MPKIEYDIDLSIVTALDHVDTQQELICILVLIMKELQKGKVIWREYFKMKIEQTVKRNVRFDKNVEERVKMVMDILGKDDYTTFTKKLEAFRN